MTRLAGLIRFATVGAVLATPARPRRQSCRRCGGAYWRSLSAVIMRMRMTMRQAVKTPRDR